MAGDYTDLGFGEVSRLNGWKDIASYLGKSVRTVQRWEALGLPVRRVPSAKGEIVFAFKHEIDSWQTAAQERVSLETPAEPACIDVRESQGGSDEPGLTLTPATSSQIRPRASRTWKSWVLAGTTMVVLVGCVLFAAVHHAPPQPASFRVDGNLLTVLDGNGKEIWHHAFPVAMSPTAYEGSHKTSWFGDLDGDGRREFLFVYTPVTTVTTSGALYCFSGNGHERWHFIPGQPVHTADESFSPPYQIFDIAVVDSQNIPKIVVSSYHYRWFPSILDVLSANGDRLGEYWHSGVISTFAITSLQHDGREQVLLGTVDNEYQAASLVVLDLDSVIGTSTSRQNSVRYQLQEMPLATDRARLLFQRTCVNKLTHRYNLVNDIIVEPNAFTVDVYEDWGQHRDTGITYRFSNDLHLQSAIPADSFYSEHKQFEAARALHHHFTAEELDDLSKLRYLN